MNTKPVLCLLLCAAIATACRKSATITLDTPAGTPGDIVALRIHNGTFAKEPIVRFGSEPAVVITSSDTLVTVIVPAIGPELTKLSVDVNGKPISTPFEIWAPDTERLWFTIKGSTITYKERQVSREDFVRDKSHSMNKLLLEFLNSKGEVAALAYIDHPAIVEVPAQDGKGLSMVQRQGEVPFDVNIPSLEDLSKVRVSSISSNTEDNKPRVIAEVSIPVK
ncbi:MAG: IPT/TIG domain-containing protein [Chryseolinea sp.]